MYTYNMRKATRTILWPTAVVFCAVLLLVGISFFMARNTVKQELKTTVDAYSKETEETIKERLNIFEITLRAGQGLLSGNQNITQSQWEQFVKTSTVLERYPSSRSVNYAKVVTTAELPAFTTTAQSKTVPEFKVYPENSTGVYTPLLFFAPYTEANRKFYGYDTTSDPVRQAAIYRARDTGQLTISDGVQRLQDPAATPIAFIMYAPQYKPGMPTDTIEQRQQAIDGYTYAGFNLDTFAGNSQKAKNMAYVVKNGDTGNQLYKSAGYDDILKSTHFTKEATVQIGATTLQLSYVYNPDTVLPSYISQRPIAIIIFGLLVAMLIALTVWLVLASKANELLLDQERGINDAKDNLLSLASHQLRTPATGVKQYIGLILQGFAGDVSPRQQDILEKAYQSNERQLKTINDILYVARLGSGRIVLTKTTFSVSSLVRDIVREVSEDIKSKHHKVIVKVPKKERLFYGDEHMIRMAIENLVSNAIKYTHEKGNITVRASFTKELKLTVEDNGIGIPDDQQEEMFQQFVRIDNELSISVGGTGIGLYVVKNIADLHGGHITVASKQGKGSTFTIILPYQKEEKSNKV